MSLLFYPTSASSGVTDLNVATKTTTYTVTTADDYLLLDSSSAAFTATLPAVATATKKLYFFEYINDNSSNFNAVTIDGNGAETIEGAANTTLNTKGEVLVLFPTGSEWKIVDRRIPSVWTDHGAITITGTTTNPTKGGSITVDKIYSRRVGSNLECRFEYRQTSSGGNGSGGYLILIPNSLTIDTSLVTADTNLTANAMNTVGSGQFGAGGVLIAAINVYDSTHVHMFGTSDSSNGQWGSALAGLGGASITASGRFVVPISGWKG